MKHFFEIIHYCVEQKNKVGPDKIMSCALETGQNRTAIKALKKTYDRFVNSRYWEISKFHI